MWKWESSILEHIVLWNTMFGDRFFKGSTELDVIGLKRYVFLIWELSAGFLSLIDVRRSSGFVVLLVLLFFCLNRTWQEYSQVKYNNNTGLTVRMVMVSNSEPKSAGGPTEDVSSACVGILGFGNGWVKFELGSWRDIFVSWKGTVKNGMKWWQTKGQ